MPLEEILAQLRRRPFVPFRLHITDGSSYDVRHPEMLMAGTRSLTVGIPSNPNIPVYARTEIIALVHVARIEPLQEVAAGGNGQA